MTDEECFWCHHPRSAHAGEGTACLVPVEAHCYGPSGVRQYPSPLFPCGCERWKRIKSADDSSPCTQCGDDGSEGFHACQGVPGGFGEDEES